MFSVGSPGDKGIVCTHRRIRQRKTKHWGALEKNGWGDVLEVTPQFTLEPILLLDLKNRSENGFFAIPSP